MKVVVVGLLALVSLASGRSVDYEDNLEDITAYGYLTKYGMPLADRLRKAEEAALSGSRIVGGSPSNLGQFPYQAGLIVTFPIGQGICGGSLLSSNRVLTAAHCWWDGVNQGQLIEVVLGSIRMFTGGVRMTTRDVVMHGSWFPVFVRNDVAMIRLPTSVGFNNNIGTIALPTGTQLNENFAGDMAVASGFGITSDNGVVTTAQSLNHVSLMVLTNAECQRTPGIGIFVQASNICTSGAGGRSTCRGDSGGPLVVTRNNRPVLIGLTSFGHRDGCEVGFAAVYARTTFFDAWIRSNL